MSDRLIALHKDGRRPYRIGEPLNVYCAYSLDEPVPVCPMGHRGGAVEMVFRGQPRTFYRCYDSRLFALPDVDYIMEEDED